MMKLVCTNSFLNMLCVHTLYEHCTNAVQTKYIQCMYKMDFVHTPYVLLTFDTVQYELVCTDLY